MASTNDDENMWKKIIFKLINNYAGVMLDDIKANIAKTLKLIGLKTMAGLVILSGIIFLLISLVILLNDLIKQSHSIGYAIVGLLAIVCGLLVGMKK
jgi:hypothetical protein